MREVKGITSDMGCVVSNGSVLNGECHFDKNKDITSSQQNLYDINLLLCVQYTADDGQKTCPKHIEFYSKNKFEKLVLL